MTTVEVDWAALLDLEGLGALVDQPRPRQTVPETSHDFGLRRGEDGTEFLCRLDMAELPALVPLLAVLLDMRRTNKVGGVLRAAVNVLLALDLPEYQYDRWIDFLWSVAYDGGHWRLVRLRALVAEFSREVVVDIDQD